jgi:hypothetical protein
LLTYADHFRAISRSKSLPVGYAASWQALSVSVHSVFVEETGGAASGLMSRALMPLNCGQCRDYFCKPNMTHKDRTGWLGREDSNLRMAESKSGYKGVFMKPKFAVATIASLRRGDHEASEGPVSDGRQASTVVRTISE